MNRSTIVLLLIFYFFLLTYINFINFSFQCDQDKQGVVTNAEKMDEYVKEHNFAGWFETSAKENINIDEAARALVNKVK